MKNLKKNTWISYALSSLIFACLISCRNPLEGVNPVEKLGLLTIDIGLEMSINRTHARLQEVNTDDFLVTIKNSNGDVYLSFDRYADLPLAIPVNAGSYYIEVESPNDVLPAFENPKYVGKSDLISVSTDEEKVVTVTASLANCLVSVVYSQYVTDYFNEYYAIVSNSLGSITFSKDESRPGYFSLEAIHIEAHLSYANGNGTLETKIISGEIPVPAAQTLYEIHIDLAAEQGAAVLDILVDESFSTEVVNLGGPAVIEGPIPEGALLITEIMYNPASVSDTEGEWFELFNNSSEAIDIYQLVLKKGTEVQHVVAENILIDPQQFLVLGRHINATSAVSYVYGSDLTLTNAGDELVLANYGTDGTNGNVVASVDYGGSGFPEGNGASLNLDPQSFDLYLARLGTNWCSSNTIYDTGDYGTPGTENIVCSQ